LLPPVILPEVLNLLDGWLPGVLNLLVVSLLRQLCKLMSSQSAALQHRCSAVVLVVN
jgi:hypothetical protein